MEDNLEKNEEKFPQGHFVGLWMGIGLAIFSGLGISISFITENYGLIGVGPAIGVAFGLAIGQAIENKHSKEGKIRPLNEAEKKRKSKIILAGLVLLTVGVLVFTLLFLFK